MISVRRTDTAEPGMQAAATARPAPAARILSAGLAAGLVLALGLAAWIAPGAAGANGLDAASLQRLRAVVDGDHRRPEYRARDGDRHPIETLAFFGVRPDMTVVELWPYGGWYSEILAPYLRPEGRFFAALLDTRELPGFEEHNREFRDRLRNRPEVFAGLELLTLAPDDTRGLAPPGSVDAVLSFRHMHEWAWFGISRTMLAQIYRALKPGGVFGIVEHRAKNPDQVPSRRGEGYVGERYAIGLIEGAGFRLVARSDVNNNPKDTKDYLRGIWMLPPNLGLPRKYRQKYEKIGEPDRFTLKFVKPAD